MLSSVRGDYGGLFFLRHSFGEVVDVESENTCRGFVRGFRQGSKDREKVLALFISFCIRNEMKR
jgi:hypothetical protein